MKPNDHHKIAYTTAMAARIFRAMMGPADHGVVEEEVCPFTLESLLSCPARNNRDDQEPCPFSLEQCMG